MIRLVMDETKFRDLVAGKVVRFPPLDLKWRKKPPPGKPVELILSDIGWARMLIAVEDAMRQQRDQALDADHG